VMRDDHMEKEEVLLEKNVLLDVPMGNLLFVCLLRMEICLSIRVKFYHSGGDLNKTKIL
jgi:hypothetical protein